VKYIDRLLLLAMCRYPASEGVRGAVQ
jgi:hypothetical protein